ncbi:MAG: class I SAM-dependent methyltransferase, partial [Dehalococcoidia bacterium]|nr:class I SAM-dependent methyltransferase [Dehalococcoidia bacterium]
MKTKKREHRSASLAESQPAVPVRRTLAQDLFDGVAPSYDTWAQVLTYFQYLRWREFLVSRMALRPGTLVLDVCTGTAGVAMEIADHHDGRIVGIDVSHLMLEAGLLAIEKKSLDGRVQLVQGRAEHLPFPDETFDAVVFTYLLRYVQEPDATIRELSRVLKPGGQLLSLEFDIPEALWMRALWELNNRVVMPLMTIPVSRSWHRMGCFLGPSISDFCHRWPVDRLAAIWRENGIPLVQTRRLLLGVAGVMRGT